MRVRRGVVQFGLAAMLLSLSFPAEAQQPKKVPRIGYLSGTDQTTDSIRSERLRIALRQVGHIERTEHCHRVPICGGEEPSASYAGGGAGAPQG
jgi:hypothetical protein